MDHRVDHWIVGILSFFILTVLAVSGDVESRLPPLKKAAAGPVRAAKRAGCAACHLPGAFGDSGMRGDGEDAALGGGCAGCHTAERDEPDAWEREGGLVPVAATAGCRVCHAVRPLAVTHGRPPTNCGTCHAGAGLRDLPPLHPRVEAMRPESRREAPSGAVPNLVEI